MSSTSMKRYWASWWSGRYESEGCTQPPFQFFVSGFRDRNDGKDEESCIVWMEAASEDAVRSAIRTYFPDYEERFVNEVDEDFRPNDRFPGMTLQTAPAPSGDGSGEEG